MTRLEYRFEAKVDRTGDHHLWTGSKLRDGAGKLKVYGKTVTARRVAWELKHGPLASGISVNACPDNKACVRVDHLSLRGQATEAPAPAAQKRSAHGAGSKREIRPGVWELSVTRGSWPDGRPRREFGTARADGEVEASRALSAFVAELDESESPKTKEDRDITVDQAVDRYLDEYMRDQMGAEKRTIKDYRNLYKKWFKPEIASWRLRDVDKPTMDWLFGKMRAAGLSRSMMSSAKGLRAPLLRWAKDQRMIRRLPITKHYQLPKIRASGRGC